MSEEKVKDLEKEVEHVEVADKFKADSHRLSSPAGDAAGPFVDKVFTMLDEWLQAKLPAGIAKTVLIAQLSYIHALVKAAVIHALS